MYKHKLKKESEGFGDTIAKITHFLRIDRLANTIARWMGKKDCGCDRRRKKLNEVLPYKK